MPILIHKSDINGHKEWVGLDSKNFIEQVIPNGKVKIEGTE